MQLKVKEAIRTVGVHTCPQLQWDGQFKVMKDKMIKSIAKLNSIEIKTYLMHLYFNACLLKKVFFGCGAINIKDFQYKTLRNFHETKISKMLRIGSNFPREELHLKRKAI